MLYNILRIIFASGIGLILSSRDIFVKDWEYWVIFLLVLALMLLGYHEGLQLGLEMMMDAGV